MIFRSFGEGPRFARTKRRATPPPNPLPEAERGDRNGIIVVRASGLHPEQMQAGGPHHNRTTLVPPLRFGEGARGWGFRMLL